MEGCKHMQLFMAALVSMGPKLRPYGILSAHLLLPQSKQPILSFLNLIGSGVVSEELSLSVVGKPLAWTHPTFCYWSLLSWHFLMTEST